MPSPIHISIDKGDAEISIVTKRIRELFFRFVADKNADNLIFLSRIFRKEFGNRYSLGLYFGYAAEHSGVLTRMLFGGHLGYSKVLQNAPIDLICCPDSYGLRRQDRSHGYMNSPDSAALHGIRSILENDIRNYRNISDGDTSGPTIFSMRDSFINDRRLAVFGACHCSVIRYLALAGNADWFASLQSIESIRKIHEETMNLIPADLGSKDQLALAIDPISWTKAADAGFPVKRWHAFASISRDTVMRSGRSVAFLVLDDLLQNPDKWKCVVIPFPGLLDTGKLRKLKEQFGSLPDFQKNSGALVVVNGQKWVVETTEDLWAKIALSHAQKAGKETIWYIGKNFKYTWDGKNFSQLAE